MTSCIQKIRLIFGTGIATLLSAHAQVVINEIHYDPADKTSFAEFIELYNTSAVPLDLSGWSLRDAVEYTFPPGATISANGYVVIAQSPSVLNSLYGITALGPWEGKLSNDGEEIELYDALNTRRDRVDYQLGFPWPTVGDTPGYSIELIHPSFDNDLGGNWRASFRGEAISSPEILIPQNSDWNYLKGTSEASIPATLWREVGFDDSGWLAGQAPVGYGEPGHVQTTLTDMRGNYSGIFLRKSFEVDDPLSVTELQLSASYDDGFKLWINGTNLLNVNISASELPITGTANSAIENLSYSLFSILSPSTFLVQGTNTVAVQAHNVSLAGSNDFWFDASLAASIGPLSHGPTPGGINSVYATSAPPRIRQVDHSPNQPKSGEPVVLTAKITDPEGVGAVSLQYQVVTPGAYIALSDAAYTSTWTTITMSDDGTGGDALAGDSIYTATLPGMVQQHRRLVRYRISASDGVGESLQVPYADDPQPNFAYFCYDGIPAWQAAVQPGATPALYFDTNVMRRLPAVHLISKNSDVETATWFDRYTGDLYKWEGTLVYDGKVYDHIRYRMRGGTHRYDMVKNMWKFDFNRGHDFQLKDDYGKKYGTKMTKLNLGACIQQNISGQHRGEQGMFESVGSTLFNLAGVPSFNTTFMQLRIIDNGQETTFDQYEGDFWGLYLALEQPNGRFLDEHDLPDGNFYKMEGGNFSGELNNLSPWGPTDKSDLYSIRDNASGASDAWWEASWDLDSYYSYQAIVQAIHHYDINAGKNYFYYSNHESGLWQVIPWDLDLTWANNMYNPSWGGNNELASRILDAGASGNNLTLPGSSRLAFRTAFRNRIRELRDLLFNVDQTGQLIDEKASLLRDLGVSPSFLDADRAMWDYNPKMDSSTYSTYVDNARTGQFYRWPIEPTVSKDFEGCVQLMKDYVVERSFILDTLAADSDIPNTPSTSYTGAAGYPLNDLSFQCSVFSDPQGSGTFGAMEWRAGEVLDPSAPSFDPDKEPPYEINAEWESGVISNFSSSITIPVDALKVGHAYRVRVRMKDSSGRWSHWSDPVEFIAAESTASADLSSHLRISELMVNPPAGSDYEFIELHNTSTNLALDLGGAAFTSGIDFNFPDGSAIDPNGYLLLINTTNEAAFRVHYGLSTNVALLGAYGGNLSDSGEKLTLKTAPGGGEIADFEYNASRHWPLPADGAGHSLVPLTTSGQATGALDYPGNWRASTYLGGSPGNADPEPVASLQLNEITAHTDYSDPEYPEYDSDDWIELHNPTASSISLSGWYLSDDPSDPDKWACPAVDIPAGGYLVFHEVDDFHSPISAGFGLDKAGEQVLLSYLPGTFDDRVVDAIGFKGQENGRSLSRIGNFWYATERTPDAANAPAKGGLRIAEFMFDPAPLGTNDNVRDEYIEVYNPMATNVTLMSNGEAWRIDGGVEYTFPDNTMILAEGTVLVVGFDPADPVASNTFATAYGLTNPVAMFGPWSGRLGNRSERIALERPQQPDLTGEGFSWIVEDETIYGNQSPWAVAAGNGHSLMRLVYSHSGLDAGNWVTVAPTPGHVDFSPYADQDGDGMSDYEEMISGTDPTDSNSVFHVEISDSGNLSWPSVSGRMYTVYWTESLSTPFVPIATGLTYPQSNFIDAVNTNNLSGFYKLQVGN